MTQLGEWIKTNKTTIVGVLTALWAFVSGLLISNGTVSTELAGMITTLLLALGLIAAKDNAKHSTTEQVQKATTKKAEIERLS